MCGHEREVEKQKQEQEQRGGVCLTLGFRTGGCDHGRQSREAAATTRRNERGEERFAPLPRQMAAWLPSAGRKRKGKKKKATRKVPLKEFGRSCCSLLLLSCSCSLSLLFVPTFITDRRPSISTHVHRHNHTAVLAFLSPVSLRSMLPAAGLWFADLCFLFSAFPSPLSGLVFHSVKSLLHAHALGLFSFSLTIAAVNVVFPCKQPHANATHTIIPCTLTVLSTGDAVPLKIRGVGCERRRDYTRASTQQKGYMQKSTIDPPPCRHHPLKSCHALVSLDPSMHGLPYSSSLLLPGPNIARRRGRQG